jgi:Ca-activated chloride channel family protein
MSQLSEREIARRLAERDDVEPPAGLLERIKSEIPAEVRIAPEVQAGREERIGDMSARQRWLIAASVVAAVGAGVFALQLRPAMEEMAPETAQEEMAAEAPRQDWGEKTAAPQAMPQPGAVAPTAPMRDAAEPEPLPETQATGGAELDRADARREQRMVPSPAAPPPPPPPPPPLQVEPRSRPSSRLYREGGPAAAPMEIEGGVEGGVAGGVVGGVVGGVMAEEITVTGKAPQLETSSVGASFDYETEIERLPVSKEAAATYRDVFFKEHGVNPFVDTREDRRSTFGLDVDTGTYTVVRRYIDDGNLPPGAAVRVEEMVNFFKYGDRPPARGDFAIHAEGAPTPYTPGDRHRLVRFNIRGREVEARNRKPAVLTFVVDVSGSMDMENRLGLVKRSLGLLLDELRDSDEVGLVVYGSRAEVLIEPTNDREAVRRAIGRLVSTGATNAEAGIALGYDVASRHFRPGAVNRVVLCSDGVANVGATGPESILARIDREARRGIEITTLGFGMGNYNDVLMEQLANKGDGRYAYIDSLDEAERVLVEELTGTLQTIARDAKVQVEWNPGAVESYRLLGYENRDIADERFRDDTVDAGEIGAGHSVTALYEIELRPGVPRGQTLGTLRLRWESPETEKVSEIERDLKLSDLAGSWNQASPALRLAATVAEYAELLKGSYWAKDGDLDRVAREAREAAAKFRGDDDVEDFANLASRAARLKRRADPR